MYAYEDKNHVLHLTNIKTDARFRPYPIKGKQNTFTWQDDMGVLCKVHRVDVSTYDAWIAHAADYYALPRALIKAVIAVESGFEPAAVSHAGAQGLMQLIPKTARAMHVRDAFDPQDNIFGGTRYLRLMANRFSGDIRSALAAYHAGPKQVTKNEGLPPILETHVYVQRVLTLYRYYLDTWPQNVQGVL